MISLGMMRFLWGMYIILTIVCLFERNWGLAVYWLGALILTTGVLMMR